RPSRSCVSKRGSSSTLGSWTRRSPSPRAAGPTYSRWLPPRRWTPRRHLDPKSALTARPPRFPGSRAHSPAEIGPALVRLPRRRTREPPNESRAQGAGPKERLPEDPGLSILNEIRSGGPAMLLLRRPLALALAFLLAIIAAPGGALAADP